VGAVKVLTITGVKMHTCWHSTVGGEAEIGKGKRYRIAIDRLRRFNRLGRAVGGELNNVYQADLIRCCARFLSPVLIFLA